jgi:hypothetical protein
LGNSANSYSEAVRLQNLLKDLANRQHLEIWARMRTSPLGRRRG